MRNSAYVLAPAMLFFFFDVLNLSGLSTIFVLKLLNFNPKRRHISKELLNKVGGDSGLLERITTGNETWVCDYDVKTKAVNVLSVQVWNFPFNILYI